MNIIVTDRNPLTCAKNLSDNHLRQTFNECLILIANCFSYEELDEAPEPLNKKPRTHQYTNNPWSKWTKESSENFDWICDFATHVRQQLIERFNYSNDNINFVKWAIDKAPIKQGVFTQFPCFIPKESKCLKFPNFSTLNVIERYRQYIKIDKEFAKWSIGKPQWMTI